MQDSIKKLKNLYKKVKRKLFNCEYEVYTKEFYQDSANQGYISAKEIINVFTNYYKPKSVIDIGCGIGTWLKAWKDYGVASIQGIDGNKVEDNHLYIERDSIKILNLETYTNDNNQNFDLAMSLEVAEHLPESKAEQFVGLITSYSDIIIFSAAIPHQPGTRHINCKPLQYWVNIFNKKGFQCLDFIRPATAKNKQIEFWYRQNILVFAKNAPLDNLLNQGLKIDNEPFFYYHPEIVEYLASKK